MRKIFLTFLLLPLLVGCSLFSTKPPIVELPPAKEVYVDRELLRLCDNLPKLPDTATQEDLDMYKFTLIEYYGICKGRQAAGVDTIKKLGNIK